MDSMTISIEVFDDDLSQGPIERMSFDPGSGYRHL